MPNQLTPPEFAERDGTSQAGRALEELAADYALVDERTPADFLAFTRAYGKELTYYGTDGNPNGDWSGFLGTPLRIEDIAAFLQAPEKFRPETTPELFRSHLVLFLTFLGLHETARAELNKLTGRHLDFYYRQILRMTRQKSIPDRVNLIVDLTIAGREVLVPAGALLNAGPDSLGIDRIYATDRDLIVNRTQLAKVSSLLIDRRRTSLAQVTTRYPNALEQACEQMFAIALSDPLPPYPGGDVANYAKFTQLRATLLRAETDFFMPIAAMRDLMMRISLRLAATPEWEEINSDLEIAGRKKRGGADFHLDHTSRDFATNLTTAVGTINFGILPQVTSIDDVYDLRGQADVQAFIKNSLYFDNLDDFNRMMQAKRKFDTEWAEINLLIEAAGQRKRKDTTYHLLPADVTAFADNLRAAIGVDDVPLRAYYSGIVTLESYFYMPAEQFAFAMDEVTGKLESSWSQVFSILEDAHKQKLRQDRRNVLKAMHTATPPARLVDLIRYVLGEDPITGDDPSALDQLVPLLGQDDTDKLTQIRLDNVGLTVPNLLKQETLDSNWDRVYGLLEIAQRARLGEPPAERVEWFNIYPAPDATTVRSSQVANLPAATRWPPFGAAQPVTTVLPVPNPVLGWAVSSPLLALSEGTRVITLSLGFHAGTRTLADLFSQGGELPLRFEVSTAKGWVACVSSPPTFGDYSTLGSGNLQGSPQGIQFVLTIPPAVAPLAALPPELAAIDSPWPVLRLMLRPIFSVDEKQYVARYPELSQLQILAAFIKVEVSGLKGIQLQNDSGALNAKKPFLPFGSAPSVGSHFLLGHPEIAGKSLDKLSFNFQWMGAPTNILAQYANYGLPTNTVFTTKVSFIDRSGETPLAAAVPLFGTSGADPVAVTITQNLAAAPPVAPDILSLSSNALDADLMNWDRYLQWELNSPDFQHTNYTAVAGSRSIALAVDSAALGASHIDPTLYQVKPPYTPKLKSLSIGYTASLELRFDDLNRDASIHRVFHIHPFGCCDVEAERTTTGLPFLPQYPNDGELYIGLNNLVPPQNVAIFFQLVEGSADPDLQSQPISWSYLSGNRWLPLDSQIVSDTTRALANSGIIEFALLAADPSTRLDSSLYWIRAVIPQNPGSVCDIVGIHTQAVSATFVDNGNAPDHFSEPLPPATLTKLAVGIPEIAGVRQPYTSFGGRMAEADDTFATRVSERLRHKQRALTIWDYERLILDRFPDIHKVKCIPASASAPGQVQVIVIPDIRNKLPFDPFEPKAPANVLLDVQTALSALAPAFCTIVVKNAHYVAVRVRLGVQFRGEGNEAFYKQKLSDELIRFLSPWAYDEGAEIAIGGRIYASSIVDFVDRRPYVDYVAGIKLFSSEDGVGFHPVSQLATDTEGYYVGTNRPDAVLVAARSHDIDVLSSAVYEEKLVTGIDFTKLELDFVIADE